MPVTSVECVSEFLDVKVLADPLAIASLEAREVAAVLALKAEVPQQVSRLQSSARK
jgi:hypothetical protein